jgi:hypothetical protein
MISHTASMITGTIAMAMYSPTLNGVWFALTVPGSARRGQPHIVDVASSERSRAG